MAITYNDWTNLSHIYQYDGGVYSSNKYNQTVFDYFPDDAAVDDALYFGLNPRFDDIKVCIGTSFTADAVTFVWEYWNGTAWATLSVNDGTNNWTNLGEQVIAFMPPDDWWYCYVNGVEQYWIRCRVAAVTNPIEGGANSLQIIKAGNNRIVATETNSFTDLYNALGDICEVYYKQVRLRARIKVGDGTTISNLVDTDKQIWISAFTTPYNYSNPVFYISNNATLRLGEIIDIVNKKGNKGCSIYSNEPYITKFCKSDAGGALELYGCLIQRTGYWGSNIYNGKIWDCVFNNGSHFWNAYNSDFSRITFLGNSYAIESSLNSTFYDIVHRGYLLSWGPIDVRNGKFILTSNYILKVFGINQLALPSHFIDCDSNRWEVHWYPMYTNPGPVYRQYSFNLRVSDEDGKPLNGALVNIKDIFGTEITALTDADGRITEQILTHEKRERDPDDNPTGYTSKTILTTYSPYTLTITKAAYQTYKDTIIIDRKTALEIALKPYVPVNSIKVKLQTSFSIKVMLQTSPNIQVRLN